MTCGLRLVLSDEEEAILTKMRQVRQSYRQLCGQPPGDNSGAPTSSSAERQHKIQRLRAQFRLLKEELRRANHLKLKHLGHEP